MRLLLLLPLLLLSACKDKPTRTATGLALDPSGSPRAHTANILSFGPRPPASTGLVQVRGYVSNTLKEAGWTVGAQTFQSQTPLGPKTFTNLIARFPATPGSDPWSQQVDGLLCAHLDSKYSPDKRFLGADDAASACGLILTLAQELAEEPEQASRIELIFFDGEEAFTENMGPRPNGIFDGLYGSRAYAARWRAVAQKPKFGILLDMVGHHNLTIKVPSDTSTRLFKIMREAAESTGHSEHFGMRSDIVFDDHVPLNEVGIPTIDLIGDFKNSDWWHTPKDNLDNISAESLEITRQVVTEMLRELLLRSASS